MLQKTKFAMFGNLEMSFKQKQRLSFIFSWPSCSWCSLVLVVWQLVKLFSWLAEIVDLLELLQQGQGHIP